MPVGPKLWGAKGAQGGEGAVAGVHAILKEHPESLWRSLAPAELSMLSERSLRALLGAAAKPTS